LSGTLQRAIDQWFHLDRELNFPTCFAAAQLLLAAGLAWAIAAEARPHRRAWLLFAAALAWVALDEVAQIHERLEAYLRQTTELESWLQYIWIVPYGLAALVLLAALVPMLRQLPAPARRRLLACGVLFVTGALGLEYAGGLALDAATEDGGDGRSLLYPLIVTAEETCELLAVALLVRTLLLILARTYPAYCGHHERASGSGQSRADHGDRGERGGGQWDRG
jgi:hypothetical protein